MSSTTDAMLDKVYDKVGEMLRGGRFDCLDRFLGVAVCLPVSTNILLALLTATLPAKRRLPSRPAFFRHTSSVCCENAVSGKRAC